MKRFRGLCIGAGYFSQFHLDAWKRLPDAEIVGMCDVNLEQAQSRADEFQIPRAYGSVEQALTELRPDFVDIITRPDTHQALVRAAVERGIPVICQKPLAPDFATARAIVEMAEQAGVPLMVHENFRFQPWYREIKRLWDAGAIGQRLHTLSFRSRPGDGWGPDAYLARQPYFREMPRLLVYETGVHFIDTFRYLAGDIDEVYAILRQLNPVIRGEDAALLTFRFQSGAIGVWDANRFNEGTAGNARLTFGQLLMEGDGGSLRLQEDGGITLQPLGESERSHDYQFERRGFAGDCVYLTQRHFLEQLSAGQPFETNGRDYLRTLAVQEAVYRSAAENRPLRPVECVD
ncbi:MAG: Gfo/Idh/MocA family oxidoreductase [Planctomycetaceae bacterium]